MPKVEERKLTAVVDDIAAVANEWKAHPTIQPGDLLHKQYVAILRKLLAQSLQCDR